MFLQNAAVHDDGDSSAACLLSGGFVDYFFLHPDARHFELNRLIDDLRNELCSAEDVYDINLLRHIEDSRKRLFTECSVDARIHRDDAVSRRLHVRRDAVTGTQWAG